jgi:transposase
MISALEGPRSPELLAIVEGRKEKNLEKFWKWFGKRRAKLITHAVIDMWKAFRNSFTKHCPSVQIIYDKFHVIRHLLGALNEVRKSEMRKATGGFKSLLAGKKFILLSRRSRVRGKAREALNELLSVNPKLLKAHLLKESFAHLWSYRSKTWAQKFFHSWVDQLKWSRLKPYQRFARMVESLSRIYRSNQFESKERDSSSIWIQGQRIHEAENHSSLHALDESVPSMGHYP